MKKIIRIVLKLSVLLTVCSCNNVNSQSKQESNSLNKIMPLGASRVEGNRPEYESFRYELWKKLSENGLTFDFIGTQSDKASYPSFNGRNFDIDHEGRGGWTSGQILSGLSDWLNQAGTPDIVLFSSPGGNDALGSLSYTQAISNINSIIDVLQTANPNVTILIELMAPAHSDIMTKELSNYYSQFQKDVPQIASEQSSSSSEVIVVDMYTGFTDDLLADDVHYNESGAELIASRYYKELLKIMKQ